MRLCSYAVGGLALGTVLGSLALGLLLSGRQALAEVRIPGVTTPRVVCHGTDCPPKAATFGYYHTQWRAWPVESRPDRHFPQSISAESIPAPSGELAPALPRETTTPGGPRQPTMPLLPTDLPDSPRPPGSEGILPPDRPIRIEERPSPVPEEPMPPLPLEPLPGEGLPGMEPMPAPSLPTEPAPEVEPGLPLEPATPFREEPSPGGRLPGLPGRGGLPGLPGAGTPGAPSAPVPPVPAPGSNASDSGALRSRGPSDHAPAAVEPWAEPRPWRQEATEQATYQTPVEPWANPRPWQRLEEPSPSVPTMPRPMDHLAQDAIHEPIQRGTPMAYGETPRGEPDHLDPLATGRQLDPACRWDSPARPGVRQAGATESPDPPAPPVFRLPVCLDGFCPVTLAETEQWVSGDARFGVEHEGHTYLMADETRKQRFLSNPKRYAPVMGGLDPVLAVDENQSAVGETEFCVVYDGRLYMFSTATSLARFHRAPKKYAATAARGTY